MPKVTFTDHQGTVRDIEVTEGQSLMSGARDAGIEAIEADCGGACACATCHVYVDDSWLGRVDPPDPSEADMPDFATAPSDHRSRLSCQITITGDHEGLRVFTPETQG